MTIASRRIWLIAMLGAWSWAWAASAPAAEPEGVTVLGTGTVMVEPTRLEVEVTAQGAAELSGDALVKYQGTARRMVDAYKRLKLANLRIERQDLAVKVGGSPQGKKSPTLIRGTFKVTLGGIQAMTEDELARAVATLLDTAKDSGVSARGEEGGRVLFGVEDVERYRKQAARKASEDARRRAAELATLTGVKLGPVLSVTELGAQAERFTAPTLRKIPVRVAFVVRFGIHP